MARVIFGSSIRLARLPLTAFARETTVRVVVNGKPETLDVVSDARNYGGDGQQFFLCPACSRKVQHLYLRDERLACRRCAGLTYRSQHTKRRGLHRARDLRRKLGASEELLVPLPLRPRQHMAAAKYDRLVAQLVAAEAVIAAQLHDMVVRVRNDLLITISFALAVQQDSSRHRVGVGRLGRCRSSAIDRELAHLAHLDPLRSPRSPPAGFGFWA